MDKRQVMGKRLNRLDGVAKASGKAKYSSDLNPNGLIYGALLTCPHAHCTIKSIDINEAKAVPGVTSIRVINGAGKEMQWRGAEIASVAATSESAANDALRKIKVEYDILPHLVKEADLSKVGPRARPSGEQVTGDPDKGFSEAAAVSEGIYGIPVITHCCLESHGQVVRWSGDQIDYWPSTQNVSAIGGDLAKALQVPVPNVSVDMQYMGGGFGSKFPADLWGVEAAQLSKESGGKPVKMFLDRATELSIAGNRPSVFGKVKVGAKADGTIVSWQSETWGSGGMTGGGLNADLFPYVFRGIPNRKVNHTAVSLNLGSARAWRAPNHPQQAYITFSALEDLAAKLRMDPIDFFRKNMDAVRKDFQPTYQRQIAKGMELIDWKKNWHQRGDSGSGQWRRGLGIGFGTWGGLGHDSKCRTTINPDGTVEVEIGSQDIGTASRTMIAMVVAETTGVDYTKVRVKLGDSHYPTSGASGGSTTTGGVSVSSRKSAVNALDKLFERVAPLLNATPDQLEARDNTIRVKGDPSRSMSWAAACQKLGIEKITEMGENVGRNAAKEGLITQGVAGVQMADVSVDIETGIVKMNKLVIVQDCGLVVNPKTAESQAYGAGIMTICAALMEERITDQTLGRVLNADMEFYKLASINDIGEIVVHMDIHPDMDKRGIIGLGEPVAIGGLAAIGNATANAIGVRVPSLPLTPNRVLAALNGKGGLA